MVFMNKFLSHSILIVLLIASGVFNVTQYKKYKTLNDQSKIVAEKLSFFESQFGTYEQWQESLKQAEDEQYKREHTLTVYFKTNASEPQILTLKNLVEKQNFVQSTQYISPSQALIDFKIKYTDDFATLSALDELGTNPLGAMLVITIIDPAQKQSLIDFVKANDPNSIVEKGNS